MKVRQIITKDEGLTNPKRSTFGVTLALRWGDAAPCFSLLEQMARRQGFGGLLAQGSRALGAAFGAADLAVQVNGLDVACRAVLFQKTLSPGLKVLASLARSNTPSTTNSLESPMF